MQCFICEFEKPREETGIADFWHLNGFAVAGQKFWGTFCRQCFYTISQTPNHKIIDQESFNKTMAIYQLKRGR